MTVEFRSGFKIHTGQGFSYNESDRQVCFRCSLFQGLFSDVNVCLGPLGIVRRVIRNRRGELSVNDGDPCSATLRVEDTFHVGRVVAGPVRGESVAV